ncbi:Chaperone protein DnaJ [Orpheovirus IHUMI-LCC2]|uniref:Chaperone protein DnaJ n=1 Tax=Orpheovirus IHUMI-LCC2 TaxID=2023057 RepID=A0A2I2L5L6_9VIRU|nr:Chaperone protein DnaJ [Orpheovirus IHUMI-LCC2]SNW62790.1 Chaperone protein DnaJ [Orpheovirus IHUMI-LCC2]
MLSKVVNVLPILVIGSINRFNRNKCARRYGKLCVNNGNKIIENIKNRDVCIKGYGLNYVNNGEKFDSSLYTNIPPNSKTFIFSKNLGHTNMYEYDEEKQHVLCYESGEGNNVSNQNIDKKNTFVYHDNSHLYMYLGWMLVNSYKAAKDPKYEDGGPYNPDRLHAIINKFDMEIRFHWSNIINNILNKDLTGLKWNTYQNIFNRNGDYVNSLKTFIFMDKVKVYPSGIKPTSPKKVIPPPPSDKPQPRLQPQPKTPLNQTSSNPSFGSTFNISLDRERLRILYAKNAHDVFGIRQDPSIFEIKLAYHKLVKKWHPDHNTEVDVNEVFRKINDAYNVLMSQHKK